jgi:DNA-binding HxlR family transcriptional regulator
MSTVDTVDGFGAASDERVAAVVALIQRKWTRPIVGALLEHGRLRYSELAAEIDPISDKMLSESLQDLERYDLVSREVVDDRPVKVAYSLTEAGAALEAVFETVDDWTETYAERVDAVEA